MKGLNKIILGAVTAVSLIAGAPAFADNGRGNNNHWNNSNNDRNRYEHRETGYTNYNYERNVGRPAMVKIYDNDRVILSRYVEDRYRNDYKKGWSKHNHGRGNAYGHYKQASRQYIVGYPLPHNVTYYSVPYEVRSHLRPTPIGYQYIRVDDDVLLMNTATKKIIDAVTLFASINR